MKICLLNENFGDSKSQMIKYFCEQGIELKHCQPLSSAQSCVINVEKYISVLSKLEYEEIYILSSETDQPHHKQAQENFKFEIQNPTDLFKFYDHDLGLVDNLGIIEKIIVERQIDIVFLQIDQNNFKKQQDNLNSLISFYVKFSQEYNIMLKIEQIVQLKIKSQLLNELTNQNKSDNKIIISNIFDTSQEEILDNNLSVVVDLQGCKMSNQSQNPSAFKLNNNESNDSKYQIEDGQMQINSKIEKLYTHSSMNQNLFLSFNFINLEQMNIELYLKTSTTLLFQKQLSKNVDKFKSERENLHNVMYHNCKNLLDDRIQITTYNFVYSRFEKCYQCSQEFSQDPKMIAEKDGHLFCGINCMMNQLKSK